MKSPYCLATSLLSGFGSNGGRRASWVRLRGSDVFLEEALLLVLER